MKLLLVGNGKWGKNYISTITHCFPNVDLQIGSRDTWQSLIDAKPDGVIVATPPSSHIEIASHALQYDIPVMIEKPLALSYQEAATLQQYKAPILVNHIHLFATAYQHLREMTNKREISKIVSLGYNKGPVREYSGLWDYGCHDVAMILDLMETVPEKVHLEEVKTKIGSLFNIKMKFEWFHSESLVGNGAEKPIRKLKMYCDGLRLVYDDKMRPGNHSLPLTNALKVFMGAIQGINDPRLGLDLSLQVVKILEECQNQL